MGASAALAYLRAAASPRAASAQIPAFRPILSARREWRIAERAESSPIRNPTSLSSRRSRQRGELVRKRPAVHRPCPHVPRHQRNHGGFRKTSRRRSGGGNHQNAERLIRGRWQQRGCSNLHYNPSRGNQFTCRRSKCSMSSLCSCRCAADALLRAHAIQDLAARRLRIWGTHFILAYAMSASTSFSG